MLNPTKNCNTNTDSFSPEIQACIHDVQDNFFMLNTPERPAYKPFCEKLLACASEEQSDFLFALAYFCLMHYYSNDNNHEEAIRCALEGIKYQQKAHEYEFIARSYNILGLFTQAIGDSTKAVDYLLYSIDTCIQYQLDYVRGMAESNLADIFHRTENFDRALYHYTEAIKYTKKCMADRPFDAMCAMLYVLCNRGFCLMASGDEAELMKNYEEIISYMDEMDRHNIEHETFVISNFLATLFYHNGDRASAEKYMQLTDTAINELTNFTTFADDIIAYIHIKEKLCSDSDYTALLDDFIIKSESMHAPHYLFCRLLEMRIEAAVSHHDNEAFTKYSLMLFNLYSRQRILECRETFRAEQIHHENQLIHKQHYDLIHRNEALLSQSQHDALTGLPNRACLNDFAETTLTRALKNNCTIGVEILDIDYFKNINDSYGHIEGDRYLSAVADVLRRISDEYEDVFTARYGGDEFVIIYFNKQNSEICDIMELLKHEISMISIPDSNPDGKSYITLSQGCLNKVPNPANRIWDFLAWADKTLYEVKRNGKDNFRLKDSFKN